MNLKNKKNIQLEKYSYVVKDKILLEKTITKKVKMFRLRNSSSSNKCHFYLREMVNFMQNVMLGVK